MASNPASHKSHVVRLRVSEAEHELLRDWCASVGISVSEGLRRGAKVAAGLGPTFEGECRAEIADLVRQIRGVATNINQMAKAMNSGRFPADETISRGFGMMTDLLLQAQDAYQSLCARVQAKATDT